MAEPSAKVASAVTQEIMSGLELVGPALSGLALATRLVDLCLRLSDAPRSARTFARLVQQVKGDLQHALKCRAEAAKILEHHPPFYRDWIVESIRATMVALDDLDQYLQKDVATHSAPLDARLAYILRDNNMLVDEERALKYAHTTLLAAINALHMLLLHPQPHLAAGITRPGPSPLDAPRRHSSQRPVRRMPSSLSSAASSSFSGDERTKDAMSPPVILTPPMSDVGSDGPWEAA
ncbi:hypothetical protein B0T11DRAFT_127346 [Plectosphaerella cucumerina]|uniref:Uncharacterized protein n=1 Tax=Plectosphaerella cucumerina TaxID=40658 RepID=A0A8K0TBE8_9PEZI|nr:hypothetical protein B0T11DRAFT_127346 [Plectosphaerella cucumerina]